MVSALPPPTPPPPVGAEANNSRCGAKSAVLHPCRPPSCSAQPLPRSKHGLHIQWRFPQIAQSPPRNESRVLSDSLWWILECPTLYWREWSLVALGPAGRNNLTAGIWLQHGPQASFCVIRGEAPWCWHLPTSSSHLLTVLPAGKAKCKTTVTLTERLPMFLSLSRDAQVIELWVASCIGRGFRCLGSEHPRLVMDPLHGQVLKGLQSTAPLSWGTISLLFCRSVHTGGEHDSAAGDKETPNP